MTSGNAADPPRLSYLAAAAMSAPASAPSSCNESNAAAGVTAAAAPGGRLSRQQQVALDVDLQRGRAAGMHDDILAELRLMTPRTRADILSAAESELRAARRVQEEHDRRVAQEVHDRDVAAAMAATESSRRSRVDADARLARQLAAADAAEVRAAAEARAAALRHADGASASGNAGSPAAAARAAGSAARLFPSTAAGTASARPRFTSMASHFHDGGDEDDDFFDDADAAFDAYDDVVRGSRRPHATRGGAGRNVGNARRGGQSPPLGATNNSNAVNGGRVPFEMAAMGLAPALATQQRRRPHHGGAQNAASAPRVSSSALTNAVNARTGGAHGPASNNSFAAAVAASARTAQRHQQRDWRSDYEAAVIQRHLQEREAAGWHGGVGGPAPPVNPRHAALVEHQRSMLGARDVDRMSFEGLMELCERNGDVPTGLSEFQLARALETVDIAALEQMRAATIGSSAFCGGGAGAGRSTHGDTPDVVELSPNRTATSAPAAASGAPVFVVEDDVDEDEDVVDVDDAACGRPSAVSVASCAPQEAPASAAVAVAAREVPVDTAAPDLTCGVCLMDLTQPSGLAPDDAGLPMRIRLCGHTFHAACIKPWLLSQPRCPICRLEM